MAKLLISILFVFISNILSAEIKIGWASDDITPDKPMILQGQFYARVSEGIMDPVTSTVLAIESNRAGITRKVMMISCDLGRIDDDLKNRIRGLIIKDIPELMPENIILNATHTHAAPSCGPEKNLANIYGVDLPALSPFECMEYVARKVRDAAVKAWTTRKPGGISFGLEHAVLSHNRLVVNYAGNAAMYGKTIDPEFSHFEGYEDHSVNLLFTWDMNKELTGIIVNVPVPSQVSEHIFKVSADLWYDVRMELNGRLGKQVHILPQCSAAGDQSPHILVNQAAEERMQHITGRDSTKQGLRKQISSRITTAVMSVYPYMKDNIEWDPTVAHFSEKTDLPRRMISDADLDKAMKEFQIWEPQYKELLNKANNDPEFKKDPHWYRDLTNAYSKMRRGTIVRERLELQKTKPVIPVEIHVLRIGDIIIATNPFELYLDYGMRIKGRSPAIQTFIVQLSGGGTYLPPLRSTLGGSYGAEAASTDIGPEGGKILVERTLEIINTLFKE